MRSTKICFPSWITNSRPCATRKTNTLPSSRPRASKPPDGAAAQRLTHVAGAAPAVASRPAALQTRVPPLEHLGVESSAPPAPTAPSGSGSSHDPLHVAVGQAVALVPADRDGDHLRREPEPGKCRSVDRRREGSRSKHAQLPQPGRPPPPRPDGRRRPQETVGRRPSLDNEEGPSPSPGPSGMPAPGSSAPRTGRY